jgi:hypothetical protein
MFGRCGRCLLAVSWLALSPIWMIGQSGRSNSTAPVAPEFARDLARDSALDSVLGLRRAGPSPSLRSPAGSSLRSARSSLRFPIGSPSVSGFPQFVRASGKIFSGTVTSIERRPATLGQSVETVAVTFHIENAIRGATPGESLTISQWIGLWSSGQRYRVGERVLVFLYPNSKLGLTSCVGGGMGRLAIDPAGRVLLTAQHLAAFRRDPVLGGKSRLRLSDFALAVRRASEEE